MEAIAATGPSEVANIRQLGVAHQKLGNSLGNPNYPNIGDPQGALEQLEKSAAVFRNGLAVHPHNALFRRNLGIVDSNVSDVLQTLDRRPEALARQRQALATFEALANADPTNVAARNDVAISQSKIAEMLDAAGQSAEAVRQYEQALATHLTLSASDPGNRAFKLEVASDHNRLATVQAKLGLRTQALSHHTSAVTMSRELAAGNPGNVELRVAVALALAGRGDAYVQFAAGRSATRLQDLASAEKDYAEAVQILEKLQQEQAIEGTDVTTLENARKELARIRQELGQVLPR
jgi:tetratricopeptide (TPR) repeat protein